MTELSRRDFFALTPLLLATPQIAARLLRADVHIAIISSPEFENAARAALMSAGEARRAADLLRRSFMVTHITSATFEPDPSWTAVVRATSAQLPALQNTVIDVVSAPACARGVYYIRNARPLALWHHSLERFGAAQLNDRFRAARLDIDDHAWAGWFAVKCAWEAAARNKSLNELSFDGHKGQPLRFNRAGVLVQPLYELSADRQKVVREVKPDAAEAEQTCAS